MKIVYCIPFLFNSGGMERVLTEKVNYLVRFGGYDITIITTDQEGKPIYFPLDPRVKVVDFDLNFSRHYHYGLVRKYIVHHRKLAEYKRKLETYLRENKVDICVSLCGKEIDFLTSLKDGSRKIAEHHFSKQHRALFMQSHQRGLIWHWLGKIRSKQLERATLGLSELVVLTKQDLSDWQQSNSNVIAIPNPSPLNPRDLASLDNRRVITVGRLDEQKGYDYLIDAWKIVNVSFPDWRLDIYGNGELKTMLQQQISANGLEGKVCLRGVTRDVEREYLDSSMFVMSSRYEGLPMVLIEAISCGLPIVSFDCECGPREVIEEGVNGYLIPTFDVQQLADRMMELMHNPDLRKKMGQAAKRISHRYVIDAVMQQWIDLFERK